MSQVIPPNNRIVSVIIPTLNEEVGIQRTISNIPVKKIQSLGYGLEILVIDGKSTDLTREYAEQAGAKIIVEEQRGYGAACKSGLRASNGEIIVILDGDGTYPIELTADYVQYLIDNSLDFLTINRLSDTENGSLSLTHLAGNKVLSGVMNLLYSINVKDSQSGMYLMTRRFVESIKLSSSDYGMAQEIKIIAFRFFKASELDGKYYKRFGQAKLQTYRDGLKNLIYLFRFKFLLNEAIIQKQGTPTIQNNSWNIL
jgi:glycosyltransferase involved in cell wall biosynthesis